MSAFLLVDREAEFIDAFRPSTANKSPHVTQANTPEENPQHVGESRPHALPNASIGGVNASGTRNGYSTGIRSLFSRTQRFSGAVAKPPVVANPVQGEVGKTNRASRRYAGVLNQLTSYEAAMTSTASAYIGTLPATPEPKK